MKRESGFQHDLIHRIKRRWPDAVVMKNDAGYIQGIPDLTVLVGSKWAMLECKRSRDEHHQPNQDYYVDMLDTMSFARFVYPENLDEVLDDLESHFNSTF